MQSLLAGLAVYIILVLYGTCQVFTLLEYIHGMSCTDLAIHEVI
jgi:hypothetical protein